VSDRWLRERRAYEQRADRSATAGRPMTPCYSRPSAMPIFRSKPHLLLQFREGDRDALEEVYRAYVDRIANVVKFGFRLPNTGAIVAGLGSRADEVADAVQEVFAKSFSRDARMSYDGLRDYGPYLYAIARNVIADRLRHSLRELPTPWHELERARDIELLPNEADPPQWADEGLVAVVRAYLASIDDRLRAVHQARYVEGLSQRDAAEQLGISRQNIRTLEERLRAGLREALARR
jgi:RNA polymerase sigma factor (sigma-70 family)